MAQVDSQGAQGAVGVREILGVLPWVLASGTVLVLLLGIAAWAGPAVSDQIKLDWIVRTVALDWRDFGRDRAFQRLQYELDHQGVGLHIVEQGCVLRALPEGHREVRCDWHASLPVPLSAPWVIPRSARAVVDPDGRLW